MIENIIWTSAEHKQRFKESMQNIGKIYDAQFDREYAAALYILTSNYHAWSKAKSCVSEDGIDFCPGMLTHMDWSGGYRILIELAYNLFGGDEKINAVGITYQLDESNYQVAMCAFHIRHYGLSVDALK